MDSDIQTFQFDLEDDDTLGLDSAVFQALGAASVCWDPMDGTGVFQSDKAKAIGEALLQKIREELNPGPQDDVASPSYPESTIGDIVDLGPGAFTNGEVINYRGENYYKACDAWVSNRENGGQTFCVRRVGHPDYLHQDYDGNVRGDHG